ncbi:MAG: response regulator [Magnetococcales bacterium]|nr:response regulator [Magnetococcales bacterium]
MPLILVVEDSLVQSFFLEKILKNNQFQVLTATNGQEALQLISERSPDLVISDINMPVMTGYEMCRIIKQNRHWQAIPVILLSELSTMEEILFGLEAKADNYILKPYEEADLIRKIWELLRLPLSKLQSEFPTRYIEMPGGRRFQIDSNRDQVLNFLLSIYESILRKNNELNLLHDKMNRLNADLLAAKEKYQTLVQTVPDMIYQLDAKGRFTFINHAMERLGYSTEELLGQHFSTIIETGEVERISFANLIKQLKGSSQLKSPPKLFDERRTGKRQTLGLEVRLRPKQNLPANSATNSSKNDLPCTGEISSAGMYSAPVRDRQGRFIGTVGVLRDISERKQVEETLKQTYLQLQQSERQAELANRAKGEFLANMSHEIRTPMHAILGLSQLVMQGKLERKQRSHMEKVVRAGRKLLAILNDILDFSKIEAGKISMERVIFNLDEVITDLLDMATWYREGKELSIRIEATDLLPRYWLGDPLRLGQVLTNLLNNAIKFTEKGEIVVAVRELVRHGDRVAVAFSVQDSGVGMEPEQLEKIFQAFQQADGTITRRYGGTGLGLTICRHLVELMGGTIYATSSLGKGSCFTFLLPMQIAESANSTDASVFRQNVFSHNTLNQQEPSWQALFRLHGVKVLLVDDHEINLLIAQEILHQVGIKSDVAMNGQQAIEKIAAQAYDCVLMDIQMPVMDGLEACRLIRQRPGGEHLPIIAMTAHGMQGDRERSFAHGMNDHIIKPIDPKQLYQVLLRLLPGATESENGQSLPRQSVLPVRVDNRPAEELEAALDWVAAIRRVGGNEQVYWQIVRRFSEGQKETIQQLRTAFIQGNRQEARRLVHSVRGAAASIGAHSVAMQANELEQALVEQRETPLLVNQFMQELEQLLLLLEEIIHKQESPAAQVEQTVRADSVKEVQPLLQKMYNALDGDFDEARRSLEQIMPYLQRQSAYAPLCSELLRHMAEFETDQAQTILVRLMAQLKQEKTDEQ